MFIRFPTFAVKRTKLVSLQRDYGHSLWKKNEIIVSWVFIHRLNEHSLPRNYWERWVKTWLYEAANNGRVDNLHAFVMHEQCESSTLGFSTNNTKTRRVEIYVFTSGSCFFETKMPRKHYITITFHRYFFMLMTKVS